MSELTKMNNEDEDNKLPATEGAANIESTECYNKEHCPSPYCYYTCHPSQLYVQQTSPAMLCYYDFQHLPCPQAYYYAPYLIDSAISTAEAFRHCARNKKLSRSRSNYHCSAKYQHATSTSEYEECPFSSIYKKASLTLCGDYGEDIKRAVSFVKRDPNATLFAIEGLISEVATADDWSRLFVQQRLQVGSQKEKRLGLTAALSSLSMLCYDKKGCSVLQDFFTYGTFEMKKELMAALFNEGILDLAMDIHGCRVIQKAIRSIDQEDLSKLIAEFHDHVLTLCHDSHGNHVIQKCIQAQGVLAKTTESKGNQGSGPNLMDRLQFIFDDVMAHIEPLCLHRFGCRVVQRSLECSTEKQRNALLEGITACNERIVVDMYGNYVVQQAIISGGDIYRNAILKTLTKEDGYLCLLSRQKYASNVVERLLEHGSVEQRELLIKEFLKVDRKSGLRSAVVMAQHRIANYVIQKAIEFAPEGQQKQNLWEELSRNREELVKSPYAKHILNKMF
ncbi:hypothetical protein HJC23_005350 [Cyclotella cryptica]|uniref:PUM-HD domain-containing protein n=1 Tax=Cyclotella cryptica TaxID=29204 RepID=A0ABD3PEZ1_9STRA|eukprot:CCRYP_015349-RA/>CCRYP_015349-RA protein AED:0.06 eAED:0.06 QI:182/1/1/1/1/1/6/111/505